MVDLRREELFGVCCTDLPSLSTALLYFARLSNISYYMNPTKMHFLMLL